MNPPDPDLNPSSWSKRPQAVCEMEWRMAQALFNAATTLLGKPSEKIDPIKLCMCQSDLARRSLSLPEGIEQEAAEPAIPAPLAGAAVKAYGNDASPAPSAHEPPQS